MRLRSLDYDVEHSGLHAPKGARLAAEALIIVWVCGQNHRFTPAHLDQAVDSQMTS